MVRFTTLLLALIGLLYVAGAIPAHAMSYPACSATITDNCIGENGQYVPQRVGDPAPVDATDREAPSAPGGLTVSLQLVGGAGGQGAQRSAYVLDWQAATDNVGVTGYAIEEETQFPGIFRQAGTTTTTRFVLGDRGPGVHTFRVRAFDAEDQHSAPSNSAAFTITPPPAPPTPPATTLSNVTRHAIGGGLVRISWTTSATAISCTVSDYDPEAREHIRDERGIVGTPTPCDLSGITVPASGYTVRVYLDGHPFPCWLAGYSKSPDSDETDDTDTDTDTETEPSGNDSPSNPTDSPTTKKGSAPIGWRKAGRDLVIVLRCREKAGCAATAVSVSKRSKNARAAKAGSVQRLRFAGKASARRVVVAGKTYQLKKKGVIAVKPVGSR